MHDPRSQRLMTLLDDEHDALRAGAFDRIEALAEEKSSLTDSMQQDAPPPSELRLLRAKAAVNAALLRAAISGVEAARTRLAALQDARANLTVYDREGQTSQVAAGQRKLERKA